AASRPGRSRNGTSVGRRSRPHEGDGRAGAVPLPRGGGGRPRVRGARRGGAHAAEGSAWVAGRVGVAIATSGPGGCNLVTALADAKMDSVPMVAITGQVPTPVVGNDAFHEADIN